MLGRRAVKRRLNRAAHVAHFTAAVYNHDLHTARSNATHVGTVELIRAISETVLELEKDGGTPSSPFETLPLTNEVMERLSHVYEIIGNIWLHQEAPSEEEVYRRLVQQ